MAVLMRSPLYAIADTVGRPGVRYDLLVQSLCVGGASLVQLRAKGESSQEFLRIASEVKRICSNHGVTLIINDRLDICLATNAEGVHLGQEDLPIKVARKLLGDRKVIGVSTHNAEQARVAEEEGADYVGFGPLFPTTTKQTGYSPRGLEQLRQVRSRIKIPIVAIGGITLSRAPATLRAGANAVAMISEIATAADPESQVRIILSSLKAQGTHSSR